MKPIYLILRILYLSTILTLKEAAHLSSLYHNISSYLIEFLNNLNSINKFTVLNSLITSDI